MTRALSPDFLKKCQIHLTPKTNDNLQFFLRIQIYSSNRHCFWWNYVWLSLLVIKKSFPQCESVLSCLFINSHISSLQTNLKIKFDFHISICQNSLKHPGLSWDTLQCTIKFFYRYLRKQAKFSHVFLKLCHDSLVGIGSLCFFGSFYVFSPESIFSHKFLISRGFRGHNIFQ